MYNPAQSARGGGGWQSPLFTQCSFQARASDLLPARSPLKPVCQGCPHPSPGNLLLPERQSPTPASPHPAFPAPIKLSQSTGLETGEGSKKSKGGRELREDGASLRSHSSVFCHTGLKTGRMHPLRSPATLQGCGRVTALGRGGSRVLHLFGDPNDAQVPVLQSWVSEGVVLAGDYLPP